MTSKERLQTAWSFREPDRVPIEFGLTDEARQHPRAERVVELMDQYTDNFVPGHSYEWGFLGWPATQSERILQRRPGQFTRKELTIDTSAGRFNALTYQPEGAGASGDYRWEKRFITQPADLERLLDVPLPEPSGDKVRFNEAAGDASEKGIPLFNLLHPLGTLVRRSKFEEVYTWFIDRRELMHRFLQATSDYVARAVEVIMEAGAGPYFVTYAHEMFLPPWAGHALWDEYIHPYDKRVNDVIHRHGGKLRAHCHGNAMRFLERFVEMGIDATEPLEPPPVGDCDLAEAKRRVGDRMMLSGNIPSQYFVMWRRQQVEEAVQDAIRAAAPGGGFSLRMTGGNAGTSLVTAPEQIEKILENCEAYLEAGLKYGEYPIKC